LQLKRLGLDLESSFVRMLEMAPCNRKGNAGAMWNADIRPWAVQRELLSLIRELHESPDLETLERATELAGVIGTLTGAVFVSNTRLRERLLKAYCARRNEIIHDAALQNGFSALATRLGVQPDCLEQEYLDNHQETAAALIHLPEQAA
jgi:hypothetical protein